MNVFTLRDYYIIYALLLLYLVLISFIMIFCILLYKQYNNVHLYYKSIELQNTKLKQEIMAYVDKKK